MWSSACFLTAILFDLPSKSDVTEEIQIEGTSADGPTRSSSRILTAKDTVRARTVPPGSPGSTRVHAVELVDLGGLVHWQVVGNLLVTY